MKKITIALLALLPMAAMAQDNIWEQPESEDVVEVQQKTNPDQKYLRGAVPEVDGKIVFSTTIDAPGKKAGEIYAIVQRYMARMMKEKNQISNQFIMQDSIGHVLQAAYEEWLVFKSTAIVLDRTRMTYALEARCSEGKAVITLSHIRYLYEEERDPQRITAEEWISDKEAVNKKNTRLYPQSGKFRRKTIDRKDFLFNKIASLLK